LAEDYLQRCQIPFILRDKTLHDIYYKDELKHPEIQLMTRDRYITKDTVGMLHSIVEDLSISKNMIHFNYGGVPVKLKVIHRHYKVLDSPDTVFYGVGNFKIPNPVAKYFNMKNLIR